jgi:hypothetical protein
VRDREHPVIRSRLELWWQSRTSRRQNQEAAWAGFTDLDGFHVQLRMVEGQRQMCARDGALLAVINEGRIRGIDRVQVIGGPVYLRKRLGGGFLKQVHFVEASTGDPVVKVVGPLWGGGDRVWDGRSGGGDPHATIQLLGDRWGTRPGGGALRLLVDGKKLQNAVMSAVDQSGTPLMRFRAEPGMRDGCFPTESEARLDVVLSPYLRPTPELLLIAALASPRLISFFKTEAGK